LFDKNGNVTSSHKGLTNKKFWFFLEFFHGVKSNQEKIKEKNHPYQRYLGYDVFIMAISKKNGVFFVGSNKT
jgi:hypothetical protein